MKASRVPRILAWTAAAVAGLIVLTGGLIAAIDAGFGRSLLVWGFAVRLGREIQVNGALHARLFSRTPEIIAEQVIIGNPAWMPAGRTAEVGKLTLLLQLPAFAHPGGLVRLAMQDAVLHLVRNADGHANWQITDPARRTLHGNSPIIRSLSVPDARVDVAAARRHLQFVGTVSASAPQASGTPQAVRIAGAGLLNGRPATFGITADPLTTASHTNPYHFTFSERSGGSRI